MAQAAELLDVSGQATRHSNLSTTLQHDHFVRSELASTIRGGAAFLSVGIHPAHGWCRPHCSPTLPLMCVDGRALLFFSKPETHRTVEWFQRVSSQQLFACDVFFSL